MTLPAKGVDGANCHGAGNFGEPPRFRVRILFKAWT